MIDDLARRAAEKLRQIAAHIESEKHFETREWLFDFADLTDKDFTDRVSEIRTDLGKSYQAIYTFELAGNVLPEQLLTSFDSAKKRLKLSHALPRRNGGASNYMYVGKSDATAKRIDEHLGFRSLRTYSLHLKSWATELTGGFRIRVYGYNSCSVLQYLEDHLGNELLPIFGKRGSK